MKRSKADRIICLPKAQWQDAVLPGEYTTTAYYDVTFEVQGDGCTFALRKKALDIPETHREADTLYAAHWPEASAWGVLDGERLVAAIETCPEEWNNRLRVTELWVDAPLRGQGIGHALLEVAKEQALQERRRAVILETQSCNVPAIGFYLHEGFSFIGLDTCCYSNDDLLRKEVRVEMGWFPE